MQSPKRKKKLLQLGVPIVAVLCYNEIMNNQNITQVYYTPIQLKLPVDMEKIIKISDPVYSFNEVMNHIDLNKYLVIEKNKVLTPIISTWMGLKSKPMLGIIPGFGKNLALKIGTKCLKK